MASNFQSRNGAVTIMELIPNKSTGFGRLRINLEVLVKILKQIGHKPVAIVSINGKKRSGKSFMATQFVKYLTLANVGATSWLNKEVVENFEWKAGMDPVTSGIQVWHEPFFVNCEGKKIGVILMDTQGLHDANTSTQENSIIFGLSILLSSTFIFNEKNTDSNTMQYLLSFLEFAKFAAAIDDKEKGASIPQCQLTFQKLILLWRDFESEDEYPFGYYDDRTPPPNLKKKLFGITDDIHEESKQTNSVLVSHFEEIAVYAMSSPGLKKPDKFKHSPDWEPSFQASVVDFVQKVLSPENLLHSTKRVFGEEFSANELIPFVENWGTLIRESEGMIESKTVFDTNAEIYYSKKIDTLVERYKKDFSVHVNETSTGMKPKVFDDQHEKQAEDIQSAFDSIIALGGESTREKFKGKLLEKIEGIRVEFQKINTANLKAEEERIAREQEQIDAKLREERLVQEEREKSKLELDNLAQIHFENLAKERVDAENRETEIKRDAERRVQEESEKVKLLLVEKECSQQQLAMLKELLDEERKRLENERAEFEKRQLEKDRLAIERFDKFLETTRRLQAEAAAEAQSERKEEHWAKFAQVVVEQAAGLGKAYLNKPKHEVPPQNTATPTTTKSKTPNKDNKESPKSVNDTQSPSEPEGDDNGDTKS